ncbi:UTP--glucose-1-phosphate uridylyltransferase, partial [Candidatus Roizmanbacteria bacterium CG2_30_33_16]
VNSGIEDVIIVTGYSKRSIEDHFDNPSAELVNNLRAGKKEHMLDEVNKVANLANFIYVRQKGAYGNGTPVLAAESILGKESFAVMWGDEFIHSNPPRLKQMMKAWEKYGGVMISGVRIETKDHLSRYGIADLEHVEGKVYKIKKIIEKPIPDEAPSNLATHGAYILPPDIFPALRNVKPGKGGEIWLVDAINILRKKGIPVYACEIENGKYYDTGNKLEYMKTIVEFALTHPAIKDPFKDFLKKLKI